MSDIVERLRAWVYTDSQYATAREAADEIERLRQVSSKKNITDAERSAITEASEFYIGTRTGLALSGLLSRTGSDLRQTGDEAAECHSLGMECPEREQVANHQANLYSSTLTDTEREAVRFCTTAALPETQKLGGVAGELCRLHAATLRALLERL